MGLSALSFAWKQSARISITTDVRGGKKEYCLDGLLFFGSCSMFSRRFEPGSDPAEVVLDFGGCRVLDYSGLQALNNLCDKYCALGKKVSLRHLSADCATLLQRMHKGGQPPYHIIVQSDPEEDPVYSVVASRDSGPLYV